MQIAFNTPASKSDSAFDDLATTLDDGRSWPRQDALVQLGRALMTELLDLVSDTGLADFQTLLGEALIGAFHSAAGRIEREADQARDRVRALDRDFDGSEVLDVELQTALQRTRVADLATRTAELIRDAAAECWTVSTGEVWTPWRGSRRGSFLTAAQIEAKQAIRARREGRLAEATPEGPVVAFRGSPAADGPDDAGRIFDALNWARASFPGMVLATTGAKGAERLAIKWARQKGVSLVLAQADFAVHGKAAPFRANDELMALEPVCILTLSRSLDSSKPADGRPFGPALNLSQRARETGVRQVAIREKAG